MPFVSVSELKTMMRIPVADTSRDVELQYYVDYANSTLYSALGGLTDSTVTAYQDSITIDEDRKQGFWLRRYPVVEVTSVSVGGTVLEPSKYTFSDIGCVRMTNAFRFWTYGVNTVSVNYTAGFPVGDPALGELRIAGLTMASYTANVAARAGISSEKIGQYSYDIGAAMGGVGNAAPGGFGIPPMVERILAKWERGFMVWPNSF